MLDKNIEIFDKDDKYIQIIYMFHSFFQMCLSIVNLGIKHVWEFKVYLSINYASYPSEGYRGCEMKNVVKRIVCPSKAPFKYLKRRIISVCLDSFL